MIDQTLEIFKRGTKTLTIIQDERRQEILILLCKERQLTVNQITDLLPISRPAVSHHLKLMLDAGLVTVEQKGIERYYQSKLENTLEWLNELTTALESILNNKEI